MRNLKKLSKAQLQELLAANEAKHTEIVAALKGDMPSPQVKSAFERLSAAIDFQIEQIQAALKSA